MIKEISKRIQLKMQSKMGVSIIFGLFAFLIASALSITILSASMSAMKRLENFDDSQKSQAILTSTANALIKTVEKSEVVVVCRAVDYDLDADEYTILPEEENYRETKGDFNLLLKDKIDYVIRQKSDSPEQDDKISLKCDDPSFKENATVSVQVLNKDTKGDAYTYTTKEGKSENRKYKSNHNVFELIYTITLTNENGREDKIYVTLLPQINIRAHDISSGDQEEELTDKEIEIHYTWDRATISLENPK